MRSIRKIHSIISRERHFPFECCFLSCLGSFPLLTPWVLLTLHLFIWGPCQSVCSSPSHDKNPLVGPHSSACLASSYPILPLEKCSLLPESLPDVSYLCHSPGRAVSKVTKKLPSPMDMAICLLILQMEFLLTCALSPASLSSLLWP